MLRNDNDPKVNNRATTKLRIDILLVVFLVAHVVFLYMILDDICFKLIQDPGGRQVKMNS